MLMTTELIDNNNATISDQKPQLASSYELAISLAGFQFNYLENTWVLNRSTVIHLDFLSQFNNSLADDIREAFLYYAENYAAKTAEKYTYTLRNYLKITEVREFSELGLLTFKGFYPKKNEDRVSSIRTFIRQMRYLELDGNIDQSVYKLTDQWRLAGADKGIPVLSLDPETGPFSSMEFEAIGLAAAHKYAEGVISTEGYASLLLFKATGRRPEQLSSLKIKDFSISSKHIGIPAFVVNVPRAKQRCGRFRTRFRAFGLVKSVGQIVDQHIKETISEVQAQLGRKLSASEKKELPLFVTSDSLEAMKAFTGESLMVFLKSELAHIKGSVLGHRLTRTVNLLNVVSERTGQLIHVNPYRFRYTLGTRAAIEGAGVLTIATLLDHSDSQHVSVYVANVPEYAIEISKIMNQPLARYAAAFAGVLVEDESEANKENPGATRIPLREKDCDVGSCGSNAFCQDYAPIACYLCPKFRPWANAPHHLVLQWLMEERERLKLDTGGDMCIVTINDRAIIAVGQVIKLCQERSND